MTPLSPITPVQQIQRAVARSRSPLAPLFRLAARASVLRGTAIRLICRLEGGQMWSQTSRDLMLQHYGVTVGRYTYFASFRPGDLPAGTTFGNFCSVGAGLSIFRRNHPHRRISQHPFFFNADVGLLDDDSIENVSENPLTVGHGAWLGAHTTITPRCRNIGYGAVVGTRAVVTRDVPPYAIVVGNPARQIGERFTKDIQDVLIESQWWTTPLEQLIPVLPLFLNDATLENALKLRDHIRGPRPQPSPAAIVPLQYGT